MKEKLLSILFCLLLIIPPLQLDAGGFDLINNAIHNKTTDTRGRDLINKALGNSSQDVKIRRRRKYYHPQTSVNGTAILIGNQSRKPELSLLSLELAMVQTM